MNRFLSPSKLWTKDALPPTILLDGLNLSLSESDYLADQSSQRRPKEILVNAVKSYLRLPKKAVFSEE